ncbi:histidine phosphatase family protein [Nocardioides sp. zg-536]|uniref:Histidine phosphatase family protein n=1 Tax=Nocardioides faecalis TaxID=2803858 RepID=A0A939BX44_9ACTN|nr:histidine phosphatase family protein [Nocardioides faecalis]QVI57266.1 histidine phosphatase family protein [Nocardioides faecalis]
MTRVSSRRLVVVRHARAQQAAESDVQRPLHPEGTADARALGAWLASQRIEPGVAYVSRAVRTRQTWDALAAGAGWELAPHVDGALYDTDEAGVLELVHVTPAEVDTVVVVGHNPTVSMLVAGLDDGTGAASGAVERGSFPTATAAVLELDGAWSDFVATGARLEGFHVARS